MATIPVRQHSIGRFKTTIFWIGLIFLLLLLTVSLETVSLGILYANDSLKGKDDGMFAERHLLTRLFIANPPGPVPGKRFLGYLRKDGYNWDKFLVPDELLGWRPAANVSVFASFDEDPTNGYLFITDGNGFVADVDDPPVALQKSIDAYRVVVLGASTVMGGWGVPRPSLNIVGMLRKAVRERGLTGPNGRRVELINAGVDGYNSAQEYLYFVSDLLRFKPDLVIVYDGGADSEYNLDTPFRTRTHRELARRIEESYSIAGSVFNAAVNLRYFLVSSVGMMELPWRAYSKLSGLLSKFSFKADAEQPSSISFDPSNMEFYGRNHRAFLALADDQVSVALFLNPMVGVDDRTLSATEKASWWYLRQPPLGNRIPFYEHARRVLDDLKARDQDHHDHRCIADLSHSLKGVSEPVYADYAHLLPKGNEIVAAHILDQLVLCGLLR